MDPFKVFGTNSLMIKDVAPDKIIEGNPARVIRQRFDDQTIGLLCWMAWWDWPIEKITDHLLTAGNLDVLIQLDTRGKDLSTVLDIRTCFPIKVVT